MPNTEREKAIFDLLCEAAINHKLALLSSADAKTGEHRAVITVLNDDGHGGVYLLPLGHLSESGIDEYEKPEGANEITSKDHADLIEGALGLKLDN